MNLNENVQLLAILILLLILPGNVRTGIHQKRLLKNLFKNYDVFVRPVEHEHQTLNVEINLSIRKIIDIDEKKQIVIFSGWLDMVFYFIFLLSLSNLNSKFLT